jgi:hypothetical protein
MRALGVGGGSRREEGEGARVVCSALTRDEAVASLHCWERKALQEGRVGPLWAQWPVMPLLDVGPSSRAGPCGCCQDLLGSLAQVGEACCGSRLVTAQSSSSGSLQVCSSCPLLLLCCLSAGAPGDAGAWVLWRLLIEEGDCRRGREWVKGAKEGGGGGRGRRWW